jgi:hypothetical protein
LEFNENENTTYQNLWDTEKAVLRETQGKKHRKISNKSPNATSQTPRKIRTS